MSYVREIRDALAIGPLFAVGRGLERIAISVPVLRSIYWRIAPRYFMNKYRIDSDRAPLNPLKLIEVDPDSITHFTGRDITTGPARRSNIGSVLDGDWDLPERPLEDDGIYPSLIDRFEHDVEWDETEIYQRTRDAIERGESFWHTCSSVAELNRRCQEVDRLYNEIEQNGYRANVDERKTDFVNCFLNEICVDIGRDGQLLFVDGRHRLAIAQVIGLDQIPVFPVARHAEWMKHREAVYAQKASDAHPDFGEFADSPKNTSS